MNDRMNPERKAEWVADLRSGKIEQAYGTLRTKKGMCCLGVASNRYIEAHPETARWEEDSFVKGDFCFVEGNIGKSGLLLTSVAQWMEIPEQYRAQGTGGIDVRLPIETKDGSMCCLSVLNDSTFTFNQIADLIDYFL